MCLCVYIIIIPNTVFTKDPVLRTYIVNVRRTIVR